MASASDAIFVLKAEARSFDHTGLVSWEPPTFQNVRTYLHPFCPQYVFTSLLSSPPHLCKSNTVLSLSRSEHEEWMAKALKRNRWHRSVFPLCNKSQLLDTFLICQLTVVLRAWMLQVKSLNYSSNYRRKRNKNAILRESKWRNQWTKLCFRLLHNATSILNDVCSLCISSHLSFFMYLFKDHRFEADNILSFLSKTTYSFIILQLNAFLKFRLAEFTFLVRGINTLLFSFLWYILRCDVCMLEELD